MGNESGRGHRSDEPPPLANVRHLRLDDGDGSTATAADEWYETERLTGQITGHARSASPTATTPAPALSEVVLDWRHQTAAPPPTALERLRQTLAGRRYLRRRREARSADSPGPSRARRFRRAPLATTSEMDQPPLEPPKHEPAVGEVSGAAPSGPRIGLRQAADSAAQPPKRWLAPRLRARRLIPRLTPRSAFGVAGIVIVGLVAAAATTLSHSDRQRPPVRAAAVTPVGGLGSDLSRLLLAHAGNRHPASVPDRPAEHGRARLASTTGTRRRRGPHHRSGSSRPVIISASDSSGSSSNATTATSQPAPSETPTTSQPASTTPVSSSPPSSATQASSSPTQQAFGGGGVLGPGHGDGTG